MDTEMEFEAFSNLTNIQSFFYGQSVFLTGVSGLVGKVVLEKLIRSCPGIGKVYVLMRPKRNLSPEQRLEKILKVELFREVKKVFPLFAKKIQVVAGDITEKRLGISFEDYETIKQNVTIVIHSAASVNFNDTLKDAVNFNLLGTKRVLDLCSEIPNLKVMVHVSTLFVQKEADDYIYEEIPKTKISPDRLIEALEWMDEKSQNAVENFLCNKTLTTYLITKAMTEVFINEKKGNLPVAIVRPSYISSTVNDPFPGWIDQLQGISGLLMAGAKGVLRTLLTIEDLKINIIPVDIVSNTIIVSAWHVGTTQPTKTFIVNCCMNYEKLPYANEDILKFAMSKREEYPLVNIFRYPDFTIYYNKYAYYAHALIDQWLPAVIIDFFLFVFTGRPILIKVYKKIHFLYDIFFRLGKKPWIGRMDNYYSLIEKTSEEDAKIFTLDTENFDWIQYMDNCLLGGRKFLAREDPSNIPYAKKKSKIWWTVTTILKWLIILYFIYYLFISRFLSPLFKSEEENLQAIEL